jgi:hypothetical protein
VRFCVRSEWTVPAPQDDVIDVLDDIGDYPSWWPEVRSARQIGPETAGLVIRSVLPYALRVVVRLARRDRAAGVLEAYMSGDIVGSASWRISAMADGTHITFEEDVEIARRLLAVVTRVAPAVARANHAAMMASGRRGLAEALAGRAVSQQ